MSEYQALAKQAQEMNREILINSLKEQGVMLATVDYSGAGDSGDTCDLAVQPVEILQKLTEVKIKRHVIDMTFHGNAQRARSLRETEVALDEAISEFAMNWVDELHGGWENNDGAYGTVTINVEDETIRLEHMSYYTECESHEHTL